MKLVHKLIGLLLAAFTDFRAIAWHGNGKIAGIGRPRERGCGHFFEYLSPANAPVVQGLEGFEVVYAKDQPEYIPLRTLRARTDEGKVMSRWTLTEDQRKAVARGADVYLTLMTFNGPLQPIAMAVADEINPDYVRLDFNLSPPEKNHSALKQ